MILPGTEVTARGLRWEVVSCESLGKQTLYRIRGLEGIVLGNEIDVLWPFESVEPLQRDIQPDRAVQLIDWLVYHHSFLLDQAFGQSALLAVQPGRLRFEPYQLVPALRAIRMARARLLLADGVGLGKTIQAGLIITELLARRLAHRILIVSPAGPLLEQWRLEMRDRFGLRLETIDRSKIEDIRRRTELGSNPFDHIQLGLSSVDFLKQERVLDQLERSSYDIVIIDEAHHCMDIGGNQSRDDSLRRRLAEVLARRCDSFLLLTATPHDGNDRSFASLCELLDPSLVDGRGSLRGESYRRHVVRRLKKHITIRDPNNPGKTKPLFPERSVNPRAVTPDTKKHSKYVSMQKSLLDLVAPELRRAFRNRSYSDVLSWIALLKRSVSTAEACWKTLQVVADRYQQYLTETSELQEVRRQRIRSLREYERKLQRFGTISPDEERERNLLEAEDIAQQLASMQRELRRGSYKQSKVSDVVTYLDELIDIAEKAKTEDPKLDTLESIVSGIRDDEPKANILIYTEYVDSLDAIKERLDGSDFGTIMSISGDDDEKTRIATTKKFRTREKIILVSTDTAAEGLNLHDKCHHLIHFELPFNPNRLEQRNGRIDRYGQKLEPRVFYMYVRGTFEERILLRLIAKYEKQRARLTFVPNTLGISTDSDATQARLLKGLIEEDAKLFKDEPTLFNLIEEDENEGTDEATKELLEEIDRSLHRFKEAARLNAWLGDAGLNAEESLAEQADDAHQQGSSLAQVDLAKFVCDAIQLDGGRVVGNIADKWFDIEVPSHWLYGLDDLPGYDSDRRVVRLTTHLDTEFDDQENTIGYLGRAHPLIRRAIDRVRNLTFGSSGRYNLDTRASVVKSQVKEPTILYTFLGRISSSIGREYERVLAATVSRGGIQKFFDSADGWLSYANVDLAISTEGVWKDHFKDWAEGTIDYVKDYISEKFQPLATQFADDRKEMLAAEGNRQDEWLTKRSEEITGKVGEPIAEQIDAFPIETTDPKSQPTFIWQSIEDPAERLAAFHNDRSRHPSARAEAEGVLRIYQQRMEDLKNRADLRKPEIIPLGMLMIIPEDQDGI